MTGSEKQKAWAEKLVRDYQDFARLNVVNAQRAKANGLTPDGANVISVESAMRVQRELEQQLATCDAASKIIDLRGTLTQAYLKRLACVYDREVIA